VCHLEDARLLPLYEPAVAGAAAAEFRGQGIPLTPRSEPIDDPGHHPAIVDAMPSALWVPLVLRNPNLDARPQLVGQLCVLGIHPQQTSRLAQPSKFSTIPSAREQVTGLWTATTATVDLDLDLDVDVVVDVVVDGDVYVDVDAHALTAPSSDHLGQHRHHGLEQLNAPVVALQCDEFPQLQDIERGSRFHRLAPRDLVVLRAVCLRVASGSLCDVAHHRLCRSDQLVAPLGMAARNILDDLRHQGEKLDGALIHVEALEAQHVDLIGRARTWLPPRAVSAVGVVNVSASTST